jgi:hypothetical protein
MILQKNIDIIKAESDVDHVTEEYSSGIETEEVYLTTAFHVKNFEPDVFLFCDVTCAYVCMCVQASVLL